MTGDVIAPTGRPSLLTTGSDSKQRRLGRPPDVSPTHAPRLRLTSITVGALALLAVDGIVFIVGFATCLDSNCSDAHSSLNGVAAYVGIALAVVCAILFTITAADALLRRRT
jgi:hypothetical protein